MAPNVVRQINGHENRESISVNIEHKFLEMA